MKWFLSRENEYKVWRAVEAEEMPAGGMGPFETEEEAKFEASDMRQTERGTGLKDVFEKLILMIATDNHVLLSSSMVRPTAHHVIVLLGKQPLYKKKIVKFLLMELADQIPENTKKPKWGAGWNCLTALWDILGHPFDLPEDHRGKIRELSRDWIDWGEKNGYSITG